MRQLHGLVEFRQLDEWSGVIDVGTLLVPNSELSALLIAHAERHGRTKIPDDASVSFFERYDRVRSHVTGVMMLTYSDISEFVAENRQDAQFGDLLKETLFDLLSELCDVLVGRFGNAHVRLLGYFD